MMGIIPAESLVLEKQLDLISNRSILWTDYGLRSLSKISGVMYYLKHVKRKGPQINTEHYLPYWRGAIWINMNYSQVDGPYKERAGGLYEELRSNLIRNIVRNYHETGYLWENYDQENKGKGKGTRLEKYVKFPLFLGFVLYLQGTVSWFQINPLSSGRKLLIL